MPQKLQTTPADRLETPLAAWTEAIVRARKSKRNAPLVRLLEFGVLPPFEVLEAFARVLETNEGKKPSRRGRKPSPETELRNERLVYAAEEALRIVGERGVTLEDASRIVAANSGEFRFYTILNAANWDGSPTFRRLWRKRHPGIKSKRISSGSKSAIGSLNSTETNNPKQEKYRA